MTVDLLTQLQRYGEVIDEAVPPFDAAAIEGKGSSQTALLEPEMTAPRWRAMAVAGAAFAVVILLGAIYLALDRSGDEISPIDQIEPVPTVEVPSGARAKAEVDPVLGLPFEPVVPFVATIAVTDEVIEGDDIVIGGLVLQVTHGGIVVDDEGNRRFVGVRVDVVEGERSDEPAPATGSFVVVTDGGAGTYLADRDLFIRWAEGPFDAGELAWRTWSDYCSLGSIEATGTEQILGRTAHRVTCTRAGGTSELWIDTETGIVLRVRGTSGPSPLMSDSLGVYPYDFTVVDIDVAVAPADGLFAPEAPPGSTVLVAGSELRATLGANPDFSVESLEQLSRQGDHPLVGQRAPELRGPTLDGGQFDLADHLGRPAVVLWWASWCQPGRDSLEVLDAAAIVSEDIAFVGVTLQDEPEAARRLADDAGVVIPILDSSAIDPDPATTWVIDGCPVTLHIDEQGVVAGKVDRYATVEELLNHLDAIALAP